MKGLVRTAVVAAIIVCAGTAAFAIAETTRYPSARQIPTVVASPSATLGASGAPQTSVDTSTLRAIVTPDLKPTSSGEKSDAGATPEIASPEKSATTPDSSAKKSDEGHDTVREVVTPHVRDDGDERSSANPEKSDGEAMEALSDPGSTSSKESD